MGRRAVTSREGWERHNGNYKCPVSYKQGDREESFTLSGRGKTEPDMRTITFYDGQDAMSLTVGPESPDNGEEVASGG
jgi:hypothetical protein